VQFSFEGFVFPTSADDTTIDVTCAVNICPANSLECLKLCDENSGVDGEVDGGVDGGNDGGADGGVEVKSQFSFYVDYLLKMRSYDQRWGGNKGVN